MSPHVAKVATSGDRLACLRDVSRGVRVLHKRGEYIDLVSTRQNVRFEDRQANPGRCEQRVR